MNMNIWSIEMIHFALKFMGLSFQLRQVCACVNVKDGETDRRDTYGSNLFPPLFTPANLFYSVFTTEMFTQAEESSVSCALITVCVCVKEWLCALTNKGGGTCLCTSLSPFKQEAHSEYQYDWGGKGKGWVKSVSIKGLIWTEWRVETSLWQCEGLWVCVHQDTSAHTAQKKNESLKEGGEIDCSMQVFSAVLTGFPSH